MATCKGVGLVWGLARAVHATGGRFRYAVYSAQKKRGHTHFIEIIYSEK